MDPVQIKPESFLLPDGTCEVTYQAPPSMPECQPLPTLVTPDGRVVMQWAPTPGELALLERGVPVSIVLWSGGRVTPISVGVGGMDLSD